MRSRRNRVAGVTLTLAVAAALAAVMAPGANAATKIGQAVLPDNDSTCSANTVFLQSTSPGDRYAVPHAGVITRWTFNPGSLTTQLKFKVGRPLTVVPGDPHHFRYRVVGEHSTVTAPAGGVTSYPAAIPVEGGDQIGIYPVSDAHCFRHASGFGYHYDGTDTLPGTTAIFTRAGLLEQLSVSALLEPDCDGDGRGDETQDEDTSSCPRCRGELATVVGTSKRDVLRGTANRDVLFGAGGNDKLAGLAGHDIICGGEGHDLLTGGAGKDRLLGQEGNDRIRAGKHNDHCAGGRGDDDGKDCERGSEAP